MFEPVETIKTVVCGPHVLLSEVAPVRQVSRYPAFLQVVHGSNDSNKPRGMRVPNILAMHGFEAIKSFEALPLDERNAEIVLDNVLRSSYWAGRDRLVTELKKVRDVVRKSAGVL